MVSIRKYLQADSPPAAIQPDDGQHDDRQREDTLRQLAQLLIDGIERNAVEGASGEIERLRESTLKVRAALESQDVTREELLSHATHAVEALQQHNRNAVESLRSPIADLQAKVKSLTTAIVAISGSSFENIRRLRLIKDQILLPLDVRDFRALRAHLSECLEGVLAEAERQRREADQAGNLLNRRSQPLSAPGSAAEADPHTGFPTRPQAEEVIADVCQDPAVAFIVIMVINQMDAIKRKFGDQVGNQIVQHFGAFVREELPAVDQLFRWNESTIVALVRHKRTPDSVRRMIEGLLVQRLVHTVKIGESSVNVPVAARWAVLPLMASPRLLFHRMDRFALPERQPDRD